MNKITVRATAILMAAALSGALACGQQGGGCGETYGSSGTSANTPLTPTMRCGEGTVLDQASNTCVRK